MQATTSCLCASAPPPQHRFSGDLIGGRKGLGLGRARRVNVKVMASKRSSGPYSHNFDGKLVDESMIVLRKRIQEMQRVEKSYEPPQHWMEWEKQYKKENYDLDVCQAVGSLQSKLMETRPAVALGMALLLLFTLPTSIAALLFHFMPTSLWSYVSKFLTSNSKCYSLHTLLTLIYIIINRVLRYWALLHYSILNFILHNLYMWVSNPI